MANVTWTTPAGSLGIINERDLFSIQLEANSADSSSLTYTRIAGTLPPGIQLTSTGSLQGVPFEVANRSLYTFVIRASDGTNIADRTFSFQVIGGDAPRFTTPEGQLDLSDPTRVGNKWVLDGSYIEYQVEATDTDTATGQTLVYDIVSGKLPPGITMSTSGLISGTVRLTDDERYGVYGGYDNIYPYGDIYDPTAFSKSRSENFEFTVRVTDGANYASQVNSIFVFTADFWRVDNTYIQVDATTYQGYPLVMSLSSNRRPVFSTSSNLGTYRHDNQCVIKIDVEDFDPLQGDLEYSIVSGSLPTGLSIDINSGELYGQLPIQSAVTSEYTFTIRAGRSPYGDSTLVYTDKQFTMTVIGDIDIGIVFTSAENLGEITAGVPSLLKIEAQSDQENRVLYFNKTSGTLPPGLSLSTYGNIVGQIDMSDFITVDSNSTTFDSNSTTLDKKYRFTVSVSDQYQSQATSKEFYVTVKLPYAKQYGNMTAFGFLSNRANSVSDRDLFYQLSQDPNINNNDYIFRSEDLNFGIKKIPEMLLLSGLEKSTVNEIQSVMEKNHTPKTLYFGDLKTAIAKENGNTIYEVVYIEMTDNLINSVGVDISSSITLKTSINRPMLGPRASDNLLTTDTNLYNVTTNGGLSFSIAGSKLRYANPLSADIGTFEILYPNALKHMRDRLKTLGQKEFIHLPLWMRTAQTSSGVPLGYKPVVVLAYCKPGYANLIKKRIQDKNIDFKKILFKFDRYVANALVVDSGTISTDGSTKTFTLNEIINEEEIKIEKNSYELRYGDQVTADNNLIPGYLSADCVLRSADYEPEFYLTHDEITKKTTINFTNAPESTSKIKVERRGDKYLAFKKKLKE